MTNEEKAKKAVDKIILDLLDRSGMGNEWENIQPSTQRDIKKTWEKIVEDIFKE